MQQLFLIGFKKNAKCKSEMPQDAYLRNSKTNNNCKINNIKVLKSLKNQTLDTVYGMISGEFLSEDSAVRKIQNGLRLFIVDNGLLSTLHTINTGVVDSIIASQIFDKLSHRTHFASPVNEHILTGTEDDNWCYWYRLNAYDPTTMLLFMQEKRTLSAPLCQTLYKRVTPNLPTIDFEVSNFFEFT